MARTRRGPAGSVDSQGTEGPDEARIEPPAKLDSVDLRLDGPWTLSGIEPTAVRSIQADAGLDISGAESDTFCFVEYDRTRRVDKNYEKFRRYDALISAWWYRSVPAERGCPAVICICADEEHLLRFLRAADYELLGCRWRLKEDRSKDECYPGRDRILLVSEPDVHQGETRAFGVPPWPPAHPNRGDGPTAAVPTVLPGAPAQGARDEL